MRNDMFVIVNADGDQISEPMNGAEVDAYRRDWSEQNGQPWDDSGLRVWTARPLDADREAIISRRMFRP
jgi:hypothetical protein